MTRKLQKLIPAFLKQLDYKWLLNRPFLWATRIHYVLFFGLLGLGLSLASAELKIINPANMPHMLFPLILFGIPTVFGLGYWWFRSSQIYADAAHDLSIWWRNLLLFALGTSLLAMIPLSGWLIQEWRKVEVWQSLSPDQDLEIISQGLYFFDATLPVSQNYGYREDKSPERSHIAYQRNENKTRQQFATADKDYLAAVFLETAHRYLPDSYPISAGQMLAVYEGRASGEQLNADQLWEWRQGIVRNIAKWDNLKYDSPFDLYGGDKEGLTSDFAEKSYVFFIVFGLPLIALGLSFVYLGSRPFLGMTALIVVLGFIMVTIFSLMSPFININEGVSAFGLLFIALLGYGYGNMSPSRRVWLRSLQQISLWVAMAAFYFGMLLMSAEVFSPYDVPPVLYVVSVVGIVLLFWLGPVRNRLIKLQLGPAVE